MVRILKMEINSENIPTYSWKIVLICRKILLIHGKI